MAEIAGDDAHEIVGLTGLRPAPDDLGGSGDELVERPSGGGIVDAKADRRVGGDGETQSFSVEQGHDRADVPFRAQPLETAGALARRQMDGLGQFHMGEIGPLLDGGQNPHVEDIEVGHIGSVGGPHHQPQDRGKSAPLTHIMQIFTAIDNFRRHLCRKSAWIARYHPPPTTQENRIMLERLAEQPEDGLLALIGLFRDDPRSDKLDLGVGVYRDESGVTPVLKAVKLAERRLVDTQATKAYLGPAGDPVYTRLLRPILFGVADPGRRLVGMQTPGGTGALRLAMELIATANPDARLLYGAPTWINHVHIAEAVGIEAVPHDFFDIASQSVNFDALATAVRAGRRGDVLLIHGCCHNPTGCDLTEAEWDALAGLLGETGVVPLIDIAYQGLGLGLEPDAYGVRKLVSSLEEAIVAYSVDKNFGLYRDRVGALYALSADESSAPKLLSNMASLTRANWSMPPDHGAAVVHVILEDPEFTRLWREEIDAMGARVRAVRSAVAEAAPGLAFIGRQHGMFSTLALSPADIKRLRTEHGVYMAGSGRINVAGLTTADVPSFVARLAAIGYPG